jgi:hypothetical protein
LNLALSLALKSASTNAAAARQRRHRIQNGGFRMIATMGLIPRRPQIA